MAVASRPVPPVVRSTVLGMVSAAGSLGTLFTAPLGQALNLEWVCRAGVAGRRISRCGQRGRGGSSSRINKCINKWINKWINLML